MGILLNVHDVEVVFQLWLVCTRIFFILLWSLAVIQVTFPDRCWFKILFFASSHGVLPCTFALTISQRLAKALHKFPSRFLDLLFCIFSTILIFCMTDHVSLVAPNASVCLHWSTKLLCSHSLHHTHLWWIIKLSVLLMRKWWMTFERIVLVEVSIWSYFRFTGVKRMGK